MEGATTFRGRFIMSKIINILVAGAAALGFTAGAQAATNLVQNGGFEQTTLDGSYGFGSLYSANQVDHWSTTGYNFVFKPGTADSTGADGEYGNMKLWGPANGANNGFANASPAGGNFVAADGAYQTETISQLIAGLTPGKQYKVSFFWAAAQQYGYDGETTENWTVSLGNQSFTTPTVTNANHGFTDWQQQSFTFTATNASEMLSFLAHGTPNGEPPFSLLDGVSMSAAPEPASWAMMIVGFGAVGATMRRRKLANVAA
jgi:hypothetical protein